nr:MAG TPA: hypothetical protein [Caudoviricetes sp.]
MTFILFIEVTFIRAIKIALQRKSSMVLLVPSQRKTVTSQRVVYTTSSSSTTHIRSIMRIFYEYLLEFLIFYKRYHHLFSPPFSKTLLYGFLRHLTIKVISFIRVNTDIVLESLTELSRCIYDLFIILHIRLSRLPPPDGNNLT